MAKKTGTTTKKLQANDLFSYGSAPVSADNDIKASADEAKQPEKKAKSITKKFMQLDITDYEDYLNRMAQHATLLEKKEVSEYNRSLSSQGLSSDEIKKAKKKASVITRTKYITRLIEKDYQENKELYEASLKNNPAYDK